MNKNTCIIEYRSSTFIQPVFLIWYMTDTEDAGKDRLLTFKTGEIFATNSLTNIKNDINGLLDNPDDLSTEILIYDLNTTYESVKAENYDVQTLEDLINFINLVGDYRQQDEWNEHLVTYTHNEYIRQAWDYYYDYILWPQFSDNERFATWDRPPLMIDAAPLTEGLEQLIKHFEENIKIIK
jgi:hypothetical protein